MARKYKPNTARRQASFYAKGFYSVSDTKGKTKKQKLSIWREGFFKELWRFK